MHEINTAAETITSAADPDANIIFGATINPDLEGEVIITVVATGFDASYYAKRDPETTGKLLLNRSKSDLSTTSTSKQDDKALSEIDMNLGDDEGPREHDFNSDSPMPNIWSIHDEDDEDSEHKDKDEPDSKKDHEDHEEHDHDKDDADAENIVSADLEDELEKPSFLRRLGRRRKDDDNKDNES